MEQNGVKIIGPANLPSQMAENASALYAKNLQNLVEAAGPNGSKSIRLS